jgi:hypothetical protein
MKTTAATDKIDGRRAVMLTWRHAILMAADPRKRDSGDANALHGEKYGDGPEGAAAYSGRRGSRWRCGRVAEERLCMR